jgi:hypothetical protein
LNGPAFDHHVPPGECPSPQRYGQTHELKIEIIETNRFRIGVKLPDLEGLATSAKAAETGSFARPRPRRAEGADGLALKYQPRNWAIAKKAIKAGSRPTFEKRFYNGRSGFVLRALANRRAVFRSSVRRGLVTVLISGGARLTRHGGAGDDS